MHELLKGKGCRDDHCERHGNRQEGGYDHDVKIEVLSQLPHQVVVHRLGQHIHLDDDGNEEHAHQREAERLGDGVVDIRNKGGGHGGRQHAQEGEEEGDQQLQDGAWHDEHAEADEEELLPRLEELPRKEVLLKVEREEAESPAQCSWLLVADCLVCQAEEPDVEQRHATGVEHDAEVGQGLHVVVLSGAALDGEVGSQEGPAVVKVLAGKGLERDGTHHREDQEAEYEQVRQREQPGDLERRLAVVLGNLNGALLGFGHDILHAAHPSVFGCPCAHDVDKAA